MHYGQVQFTFITSLFLSLSQTPPPVYVCSNASMHKSPMCVIAGRQSFVPKEKKEADRQGDSKKKVKIRLKAKKGFSNRQKGQTFSLLCNIYWSQNQDESSFI